MKKLISIFVLLGANACAYSTHMVHVSDFDQNASKSRGNIVTAKTEQFVVLGFVDEINYVDQAYKKLQRKCNRGKISGITTEFTTDLGFFSWTNHINMRGRCIKS